MIAFVTVASLALPLLSAAQLVPTGPGPNDVFKQGGPCTISWNADTTGKWKDTFIELMAGPNQQMIHLATVANVDGTDPTKASFSMPCPSVSPNAPIYFYQFTAPGQNATWTGRFVITDPNGGMTAAPNPKQPDGEAIPWGAGKLLDTTQGSPPPPTAPPGQIDGSGGGGALPSNGSVPPAVLTASGTPAAPNTTAPAPAPTGPAAPPPPPASSTPGTTTVVVPASSSPAAASSPNSTAPAPNAAAPALTLTFPALLSAVFISLALC